MKQWEGSVSGGILSLKVAWRGAGWAFEHGWQEVDIAYDVRYEKK